MIEIECLSVDDERSPGDLRTADDVSVTVAGDLSAALDRVSERVFDCVVLDGDAVDPAAATERICEEFPTVPVVVYDEDDADADAVVEALRAGATDYVRPGESLVDRVRSAVETDRDPTEAYRNRPWLERVATAVGSAVARATTTGELATAVTGAFAGERDCTLAVYGDYEEDADRIRPLASTGADETSPDDDWWIDLARRAVETGHPHVVPDATGGDGTDASEGDAGGADDAIDPLVPEAAVEGWIRSAAAIPAVYGEDVYGVVVVAATRRGAVADRDRGLLADVGSTIGHALQRIQVTDRFREAGIRLQGILGRIDDGFASFDDEWTFTYANERAGEILDRDPDDLVGRNLWEAFPDAVGSTFESEFRRAMATQEPRTFEEYYDPLAAWLEVRVHPAPDGLSVYFRDVTDRKEMEQRLRESERRFRSIAEASPDPIVRTDLEGTYTYVSPAMAEVTGYDPQELVGESVETVVADEDLPETYDALERIAAGEAVHGVDVTVVTAEGDHRQVEVNATPLVEDGEVVGVQGILRDVTERKRLERELAESERRFRSIAEASPDPIFQTDLEGVYTYASPAMAEVTGYDRSSFEGCHFESIVVEEDLPAAYEAFGAVVEGETLRGVEVRIERADGDVRHVEVSGAPVTEDGEVVGVEGIVRDVTERKRIERALARLHEATGRFHHLDAVDEVAEAVVDLGVDVIDRPLVGVYRYDEDAAALEPVAVSPAAEAELGPVPRLAAGDSVAWEAFATDETRVYDDVRTAEAVHDERTPIRSEMVVPIGDYGALLVGAPEEGVLGERRVELAEILASTAADAIERIERESSMDERDAELAAVRRRAAAAERALDLAAAFDDAMLGASTRSDLAAALAEGLADLDRIDFAWVGRPPDHRAPAGEVDDPPRLEPHSASGQVGGYLDGLSLAMPDADDPPGADGDAAHPAVVAATTGEVVVVDNVGEDLRSAEWRRAALERGFRAAMAVPIADGGRTYAVVTAYAGETDAFGDLDRTVAARRGALAGLVARDLARRTALLTDARAAFEFLIPDGDHPLNRLATDAGGRFEAERIDAADGRVILTGSVTGGDPHEFADRARELVAVEAATVTDGDRDRVRIELDREAAVPGVADHGGSVTDLRRTDRGVRLQVEAPVSTDVRELVGAASDAYPGTEFLARRTLDRPLQDRESVGDADATLTERQREILETAYHAGFFEWPRERTGEELAADLGVSPPTVHRHLRAGERAILATLFGDRGEELASSPERE